MSKLVDSIVLNLLSAYIYKKKYSWSSCSTCFYQDYTFLNHAQKYLASLPKVIKFPNLPGLNKFVVKMYLAVTATNMYTQTLPDCMYGSQISAYKYMLWGGTDVTFYQFQILVCLNHYTFIYSMIMMITTFLQHMQ